MSESKVTSRSRFLCTDKKKEEKSEKESGTSLPPTVKRQHNSSLFFNEYIFNSGFCVESTSRGKRASWFTARLKRVALADAWSRQKLFHFFFVYVCVCMYGRLVWVFLFFPSLLAFCEWKRKISMTSSEITPGCLDFFRQCNAHQGPQTPVKGRRLFPRGLPCIWLG